MLNRFRNVVKNLTVFPENMRRNIDKTFGVIFSQRVLLALIEKGLSREDAYGIVQPLAMKAWETEVHFRDLLQANDIVKEKLTEAELEDCFDHTYHLKNEIGRASCRERVYI